MSMISLGVITLGGQPQQVTQNLPPSNPTGAAVGAYAFSVQHLPDNSGDAFVGLSNMNLVDYTGVLAIIPSPPSVVSRQAPSWTSPWYAGQARIDMSSIYVDGTAGDRLLVSYFEP